MNVFLFVLLHWLQNILKIKTVSVGNKFILWTSSSLFWASGVASLLVVVAVFCLRLLFGN